jgi:hypothetical protein
MFKADPVDIGMDRGWEDGEMLLTDAWLVGVSLLQSSAVERGNLHTGVNIVEYLYCSLVPRRKSPFSYPCWLTISQSGG